MKTIGMLGGMSWESTLPYYQQINRVIGERLGGLHSAKILLYSVDFYEVEELMRVARWDDAGGLLADAAVTLESGGADFLVLCTNTLHKVAPAIEARVRIPLLHIVDPTAREIQRRGLRRAGLLGTRYTMEGTFYRDRLAALHGIEAFVPAAEEREIVQRIIFTELCLGKTFETSRLELRRVAEGLVARGAEVVILGCTELAMSLADGDLDAPVLDGAALHAHEAALLAIEDELKAQQDGTPSTVR